MGVCAASTFVAVAAAVDEGELAVAGAGYFLSSNVGNLVGVTLASFIARAVVAARAPGRLGFLEDGGKEVVERALADVDFVKSLKGKVRTAVVKSYVEGFRFCFGEC